MFGVSKSSCQSLSANTSTVSSPPHTSLVSHTLQSIQLYLENSHLHRNPLEAEILPITRRRSQLLSDRYRIQPCKSHAFQPQQYRKATIKYDDLQTSMKNEQNIRCISSHKLDNTKENPVDNDNDGDREIFDETVTPMKNTNLNKYSNYSNNSILIGTNHQNKNNCRTDYVAARQMLRSTPKKFDTPKNYTTPSDISSTQGAIVSSTVKSRIVQQNLRRTPMKRHSKSTATPFYNGMPERGNVQSKINRNILRTPTTTRRQHSRSPVRSRSPPYSSARKKLRKVVRIRSPVGSNRGTAEFKKHPSFAKVNFTNRAALTSSSSVLFSTAEPQQRIVREIRDTSDTDTTANTGDLIEMSSINRIESSQRDGQYSHHVTVFRVQWLSPNVECENDNISVALVLGPKCLLFIKPLEDNKKGRVMQSLQRTDIKTLKNENTCIELSPSHLRFTFQNNAECLNFMHLFYMRRPIGTPAARRRLRKDSVECSISSDDNKEVYKNERDFLSAGYNVKASSSAEFPNRTGISKPSCTLKDKNGSNCSDANDGPSTSVHDQRGAMLAAIKNLKKISNIDDNSKEEKQTMTKSQSTCNKNISLVSEEEKSADDPRSAMLAVIKNRNKTSNSNDDGMQRKHTVTTSQSTCNKNHSSLSEEDSAKICKYRKMLQMKVPAPAVRHKMALDGIEDRLIRLALDEVAPNSDLNISGEKGNTLTPSEEVSLEKYRKMIKMLVPPSAVRHKMTMDGIEERLIRIVCSDGDKQPSSSFTENKTISTEFSEEDEKKVASYRKMKKILPPDALRHKMKVDGIDENLICIFFGEKPLPPSKNVPKLRVTTQKDRLVAFHWTPLSPTTAEQSFWADPKTPYAAEQVVGEQDLANLKQLFSRKKVSSTKLKSNQKSLQKKAVRLLDGNRVQNITITLTSFNKIFESHDDLLNTLEEFDPDNRIVGDRLQFLQNLLPKTEEKNLIRNFNGDHSQLLPSEAFLVRLITIPRIEMKVKIIQTIGIFTETVERLEGTCSKLADVCDNIIKSERLSKVLNTVRDIGNQLNEGTRTGGVSGFKLDSLLKLTETKSVDGKNNILDFIIQIYNEKNDRESLNFIEDFPESTDVCRTVFAEIMAEVHSVKNQIEKCKQEIQQMDEKKHQGRGKVKLKGFIAYAQSKFEKLENSKEGASKKCRNMANYFGEKDGEKSAIAIISILVQFASAVNQSLKKFDNQLERERRKASSSKRKSTRISSSGVQLRKRRSSINGRRTSSRSPLIKKESIRRSPSLLVREQSRRKSFRSPKNIPTLSRRMERSINAGLVSELILEEK